MSEYTIPEKMTAIVLDAYNTNLMGALKSLKVIEKPIRFVQNDEVIVKIDAAPCNPSDIAFIRGMYNIKKEAPVVVGFEGTGRVVYAGNHPKARALLGKRVSCFTQDEQDGTWAEYFVTGFNQCIQIDEKMDTQQAACLAINPFTAYAMFKMAQENGSKAIVQNAAAGQIGDFVRILAKNAGIEVINIVRKDEHMELLKSQGEEYVLNQREEAFGEALNFFAHKLKATTAFDAVGGEVTGTMIGCMPENSQVILYGGLSGDPVGNIDALDIIFKNKTLVGFNLGDWINNMTGEEFNKVNIELQEMVLNGIISTKIQQEFEFEKVVRGLLQYLGNMSKGKILFVP